MENEIVPEGEIVELPEPDPGTEPTPANEPVDDTNTKLASEYRRGYRHGQRDAKKLRKRVQQTTAPVIEQPPTEQRSIFGRLLGR